MAYYAKAKTYKEALELAAKDAAFNEREQNALRGAYWVLVVQDGQITEKQRQAGKSQADAKFALQNFNVYVTKEALDNIRVEVEYSPDNTVSEYYLVGYMPVQFIYFPGREKTALKYDWQTGCFINGEDYIDKVYISHSDVERISEDQFIHEVETLRGETEQTGELARLCGDDRESWQLLSRLYQEARALIAPSLQEKRRLTVEEKQQLRKLQQASYVLFETVCGGKSPL